MDIRLLIINLLIILLMCQVLAAQELRGGAGVDMDITRNINAGIEFEVRKIKYPEPLFNRTLQGRLEYSVTDLWRVAVSCSYSLITGQSDNDDDEADENSDKSKFTAELVFQPNRFETDLRLTNRFRYQYSTVGASNSKEYLRNKITLDYRITKSMNPYLAVEPYYHLQSNKINHLRIYIGNEMPVFNTKIEFYYIAEVKLKKEHFNTHYIVGAALKIKYKPGTG